MQNSEPNAPAPSQVVCDNETFRRVWRRVMPEDRADCPFTLTEPQPGPPAAELSPPEPAQPEVPRPDFLSAAPAAAPVEVSDETDSLLLEEEPVSLGRSSAVYLPQLQEMILRKLAAWRFYQQLSRRANGPFARTLANLAGDERRHAKRLSAAAFLISGVRFLPNDRPAAPVPAALPAALRAAFSAEQRAESTCRAFAAETSDEALRTLYLELAGEDCAHTQQIRFLLEQL